MAPRQNQHTELLYGIHPVLEALRAKRRRVEHIYTTPTRHGTRPAEIMEAAAARKIQVESVTGEQLARLCGQAHHQGIGARVSPYVWTPLKKALNRQPRTAGRHFLLALDGLTDPHNLGALLRTALCAGVDGVLLPARNSCRPTPTVSKISAGALEHSSLVSVTNLVRILEKLKKKGFWVAGLDRGGRQTIYASDFNVPLVLVIGGEGKGVRPLVKSHCDFLVTIPQAGPLNSLNASVAGAVAMYEVLRQRSGNPFP